MTIPSYVMTAIMTLEQNGYSAYMVGGCVRDSLMGLVPHDYDLTTDAKPEEMQKVFKDYNQILDGLKHGTLTVIIEHAPVEITTFRKESGYKDHRHPDSVSFDASLLEDLSRRDFTINSMAMTADGILIDPYGGQNDIKCGVIKCVGDANERMREDPLRILRAYRFAARLKYNIHPDVMRAIRKNSYLLNKISCERIRDELCKILLHEPEMIETMHNNVTLKKILPEIDLLFSVKQNNKHHYTDVGHHTIDALKHSKEITLPDKDMINLRLALLYHDSGKANTRTTDLNGEDHFYKHPIYSKEIARKFLEKYKFPTADADLICKLIEYHDLALAPKRSNLLKLVDKFKFSLYEYILLGYVKECDYSAHVQDKNDTRIENYLKLLNMFKQKNDNDKVFTENDLAINGKDIMRILNLPPCKLIGEIKHDLYELVFMNPSMNDKDTLTEYLDNLYNEGEPL